MKANKKAIPIKGRRVLINPTRAKTPTPTELKIANFGKYLPALLPFLLEGEITSRSIAIINLKIIYINTQ